MGDIEERLTEVGLQSDIAVISDTSVFVPAFSVLEVFLGRNIVVSTSASLLKEFIVGSVACLVMGAAIVWAASCSDTEVPGTTTYTPIQRLERV